MNKFLKIFTFLPLITVIGGCGNTNTSSSSIINSSTALSSSSSSIINNVSYINSETPGTATIKIYKDNNSTSKERYLAPKNVELKYSYNDLNGILANNENVCPSKGDVNLLVIPVHLPGDETYHTEKIRKDIEKVFAIFQNVCYNREASTTYSVERRGAVGVLRAVDFLHRRWGFLLGAGLFALTA